jgi:hypothetical protein
MEALEPKGFDPEWRLTVSDWFEVALLSVSEQTCGKHKPPAGLSTGGTDLWGAKWSVNPPKNAYLHCKNAHEIF